MNVVILGASSGIGEALARIYATHASSLHLLARRLDMLQEIAAELTAITPSLHVHTWGADVTDFTYFRDICEHICEQQPVDLVIVCFGISSEHKHELYAFNDAREIVQTNLLAVMACVDIFAEHMKKQRRGKIAVLSSLASFTACPSSAAYSASKRGLNSFLDSMRILLKPSGIKVITILPGFIKTPLTDKNDFHMPFLQELKPAAYKIYTAIERGHTTYAFPFIMACAAKVVSILPPFIRDMVAAYACRYEKHER